MGCIVGLEARCPAALGEVCRGNPIRKVNRMRWRRGRGSGSAPASEGEEPPGRVIPPFEIEQVHRHDGILAAAAWWAEALIDMAEPFAQHDREAAAGSALAVTAEKREVFKALMPMATENFARRQREQSGQPVYYVDVGSDPFGGHPVLKECLAGAGLSLMSVPIKVRTSVRIDVALAWGAGAPLLLWNSPDWIMPDYLAEAWGQAEGAGGPAR